MTAIIKNHKKASIIVGIIVIMSVTLMITNGNAIGRVLSPYHYYNDDVQGSVETSYNFGPDRWTNGASKASDAAQWGKEDFLKSIAPGTGDPLLAASVLYYAQTEVQTKDNNVNFTKINITDRTEENKTVEKRLAVTQMSVLHQRWLERPELWQECYDRFVEWLDANTTVGIEKVTTQTTLAAQKPYADPSRKDLPYPIWSGTSQIGGHWLTFTLNNGVVLKYYMEGGYQFPADRYLAAGHNYVTQPPTTK